MDRDRKVPLEKFFEDALNSTLDEYLREIKETFVKKYDFTAIGRVHIHALVMVMKYFEGNSKVF